MRNKKTGLLGTLLLIGTLSVAGCGGGGDSAGEGTVLRIATGTDPSYAPLYIAVQEGLFEDRGLNVKIVKTEGGPAATQAVIAGEAEVATNSDATAISLFAQDPELRAFVSFEQSDDYIKGVLGEGVDSIQDVKKMAVLPGLMSYAANQWLTANGVDPADVEFIQTPNPELGALLGKGEVDAFLTAEPWPTRAVEENNATIAASASEFGVTFSQWLIAKDQWLQDNPEDAAAIADAFDEASTIIADDPQRAGELVQKEIQAPPDQTLPLMDLIDFTVRDLTADDVAYAQTLGEFFASNGVIDDVPDVEGQVLTGWYTENQS